MMEGLFSLVFSKVWAILAGALALLALWFRGTWQKRRAEQAEARAQAAEKMAETMREQEKRREKVDSAAPDELVDYWRKPD